MVFPVVGGNESKGYEISNSLRFNSADSAHMHITPSASNRDLFTISLWAKRSSLNTGARQVLFGVGNPGTSGQVGFEMRFDDSVGDGKLRITDYVAASSDNLVLKTNALFRDPSAWYHIVFAYDSAQGTDSNRAKLYVNGTQVTSFATATYPSQNQDSAVGSNTKHLIGNLDGDGYDYDGYLTEVHYVDGTAKAQTDFGEFDDNGVWIPKKYTGTYGTNGFFLEFKQTGTSANSSGIGADTSGNDNHFTPTNLAATDITEDTCTNNFCTMNPLAIGADATLSEGNCQIAYGSGTRSVSTANMGFASGKWYWEWKISAASTDGCSAMPGIGGLPFGPDLGTYLGNNSDGYAYNGEDGKKYSGGANSAYGDTFTTNDIISVAFDADNGNLYFYKNGTIQNSGTAAYTSLTSPSSGFYYPAMGDASGTKTFTAQANFGNPPYSISSGNTDGKYGNFEYAPPSGYYALCTKRLAEFG
jgi:hypothetical protein